MKNLNERPILIVDSGIGGLYLYRLLKQHLPFETLYYLADTQFFPYGNKSKPELDTRIKLLFTRISSFNPKLILIACNSLSFNLENKYGFLVIDTTSAINLLISQFPSAKILATNITAKFFTQGVGFESLASQIEYGQSISLDELEKIIEPSQNTFILGCTHYSWIQNQLSETFQMHRFIDPAKLILQQVIQTLQKNRLFNTRQTIEKDQFFSTSDQAGFLKRAKRFIDLQSVEPFSLEIFFKAVPNTSYSLDPLKIGS